MYKRQDQESRNRGCVLDRRTDHLGGIDDALLDEIAVFAGLRVEAVRIRLVLEDLADDDGTVLARVDGDLDVYKRQVLGCAWTVTATVFRADVYPHLDSASFDTPVIKRAASVARSTPPAADRIASAFSELAPLTPAPAKVAAGPMLSFGDRFAASSPQSVEPQPQAEPTKLAEAPKPQAAAPKLAEAAKPKEAAPVQVAALPPRAAEPKKSPGASVRDMAQRAKAAVMSIASNEKQTIFEKLWGKQASHGSLLSYASADASVTGSLTSNPGQSQNPALGGSAPYDLSLIHI